MEKNNVKTESADIQPNITPATKDKFNPLNIRKREISIIFECSSLRACEVKISRIKKDLGKVGKKHLLTLRDVATYTKVSEEELREQLNKVL